MNLSISIAMCTFNGERFLDAQLQSICSQTQLPDELIICDDASLDATARLIHEFMPHASFPVRFAANKENLGSTKNFQQAISLCKCNLVVLADQDDIWYPNKLEQIKTAFLHAEEIGLVFSNAEIIDADSHVLAPHLWKRVSFGHRKQRLFREGRALNVLLRHPVITGATMAFRREFLPLLCPIPVNDIHDRWISLLLAACSRIAFIPEPLMQYREHETQQEGLIPRRPAKRLAHAKGRGEEAYLEEIGRLQVFSARLTEHAAEIPNFLEIHEQISKKIRHLEHRARLPKPRLARLPAVLHEMINRNYWRFSGGVISVAKDMLIR